MKFLTFLFLTLLLLGSIFYATYAYGQSLPGVEVEQTGVTVTIRYQEPTTSFGNNPLDDLAKTIITIHEGPVLLETVDILATSLTGGGAITETIQVTVPRGKIKNITVTVVAVDLHDNISDPIDAGWRIDRDPPGQVLKP